MSFLESILNFPKDVLVSYSVNFLSIPHALIPGEQRKMLKADKCPVVRWIKTFLPTSILSNNPKIRKWETKQSLMQLQNKYNSKSQEIKIKINGEMITNLAKMRKGKVKAQENSNSWVASPFYNRNNSKTGEEKTKK